MLTDVSEVCTASIIALMMEAVRTSETSVNIYLITQQYIPQDSKLHTCRRENLKSHIVMDMHISSFIVPYFVHIFMFCMPKASRFINIPFPGFQI
jgi:archaellum biogenesis protein FlaJ (TadC family)